MYPGIVFVARDMYQCGGGGVVVVSIPFGSESPLSLGTDWHKTTGEILYVHTHIHIHMQRIRRGTSKEKSTGVPYSGKLQSSKRRQCGVPESSSLKSPILDASACNISSGKSFVVGHETGVQGHHPPRHRNCHGSVQSSSSSPSVTPNRVEDNLETFLLATPDLSRLTSMIPVASVDYSMNERDNHMHTHRNTWKAQNARQCMVSLVEILAKSANDPVALQMVLKRISNARKVDRKSPVLAVTVIENLIALVTDTESVLRAKFLVDHLKYTINPDQSNAYDRSLLRRLAEFCFSSWVEHTKYPPVKGNWIRRNDLLVVYMDFIRSHWKNALRIPGQCDSTNFTSDIAKFAKEVERISMVNNQTVSIISQYVSFWVMADVLAHERMDSELFWARLAKSGVLKHLMDTHTLCVPLSSHTYSVVSPALTTRGNRAWTL